MTYAGKVRPGGTPAVRELANLTITKLSVGSMDNNAYLLRCQRTDEQVLIDAARVAFTQGLRLTAAIGAVLSLALVWFVLATLRQARPGAREEGADTAVEPEPVGSQS
jgi:hypothetical protein